jgi:hypothetical protein
MEGINQEISTYIYRDRFQKGEEKKYQKKVNEEAASTKETSQFIYIGYAFHFHVPFSSTLLFFFSCFFSLSISL